MDATSRNKTISSTDLLNPTIFDPNNLYKRCIKSHAILVKNNIHTTFYDQWMEKQKASKNSGTNVEGRGTVPCDVSSLSLRTGMYLKIWPSLTRHPNFLMWLC
ncbi:unnamed protein product [Cyberlindnera jadinii]|uniref:Uncharacterized protein n=1 Tax=Cyberlindnera jadinii (strain ATCC 18201 / CBS 1600 / BCRC 20928 / JCM 3617 / NBRC 0987 / NRRL Y-1542) TaxID=983966 RepID=A0A0H5CCI7_CYBJN|nr:unnamed protein product [Cyberlindnera jadinii]